MLKKSLLAFVLFFMASFMIMNSVSAAEVDYFDIDFSTDKKSYESEDEITSTIKITNSSDILDAKDVEIKTNIPEDFEVIGDDIEVENGEVVWDVDDIRHGESAELTLKTKLKITEKENDTSPTADVSDKNNVDNTPTDKDGNEHSQQENLSAPQTGDDSSILTYIIILIISVIIGITAFLLIRKKRYATFLPFVLAFAILMPSWTANAEVGQNLVSLTETHKITIGTQDYKLETTVTGDMQDYREEVPVTGTAYNASNQVLVNDTLTFSTTIDGEDVEQTVQTDEEGYFVARLFSNTSYQVEGNNLEATVEALEQNKIELTNEIGEIELGKTLTNEGNKTELQPSVIYFNNEETAQISQITDDLSSVTINRIIDIQTGDLIVIPKWGEYISGIALEIQSVSNKNGQLVLQVKEPEIEEIFKVIVGDIDADISEDNFVPGPGIEVSNEEAPEISQARTFSALQRNAISGNLKLTFEEEDFPVSGALYLKGGVEGDINWRSGFHLNPIKDFDVLFTGEQRVDLTTKSGIEADVKIPAGKAIIPTQIPLISVTLPVDLVLSASGDVSITISAGAKEEFGIAYTNGEGIRTYPEKHFTPFFHTSDIIGTASISAAIEQSLDVNAAILTLTRATSSAGTTGTLSTSVIGNNGFFACTDFTASFDASLKFSAPIVKWEQDGGLNTSIPFYNKTYGDCISSIKISPNEMELKPGETKSINVFGSNSDDEEKINDSDKLSFEVSNNNVSVDIENNRIDVKASDSVQDGDEITVKAVYDGKKGKQTATLKITIVDDREKGTLVGQVVDAVEGTVIKDATIKVFSEDRHIADTKTGDDGRYKVNLAPGTYKLEVSSSGYITDTTRVEISSTETTTYDSELRLVGDEYGGEGTASGTVRDAVTNRGVKDINIDIRKGKNNTSGDIIESLVTDDNGNYSVKLPGGNYTMSLSADGYITTNANIISIGGQETANQDATISIDEQVGDGLRVILRWGENPSDLDSHITGPTDNGDRFHVFFADKIYKDDENDINLDRDDVTSYGPETVTVLKQIQDGTYTYAVHNYSGRNLNENNQYDLANSNAEIKVYRDNTLLKTFNVPVDQAGNSWRVFEIRNGEIVPINKIETTDSWLYAEDFAPVGSN